LELVDVTNDEKARWIDFGPLLEQRPQPSMGCNNCGHFCSGVFKRHCQKTGWFCGYTKSKEDAKCQKYHDLQSNYYFQPIVIETTGVYGKSTAPLSGLTNKLVDMSGDSISREHQWLHQRLPLAVARGNVASILACVQL